MTTVSPLTTIKNQNENIYMKTSEKEIFSHRTVTIDLTRNSTRTFELASIFASSVSRHAIFLIVTDKSSN